MQCHIRNPCSNADSDPSRRCSAPPPNADVTTQTLSLLSAGKPLRLHRPLAGSSTTFAISCCCTCCPPITASAEGGLLASVCLTPARHNYHRPEPPTSPPLPAVTLDCLNDMTLATSDLLAAVVT